MRNMAYCRFENTYLDLVECIDALNDNEPIYTRERSYAKDLLMDMANFLHENGFVTKEENYDDKIEAFIEGFAEEEEEEE